MKLAVAGDDRFVEHDTGPMHPERAGRYTSVINGLIEFNIITRNHILHTQEATVSDLLLCHTQDYIDLVAEEVSALQSNSLRMLSTGDVVICSKSFQVAKRAVGASFAIVDEVLQGRSQRGFAVVRPPGHHACSNRGMGFCLFNNIALATRYAMKRYGIKKTLIIDWDVHHGNGTQEIFDADPSVFYFSTHQAGIYPGTGSEEEQGIGDATLTKLNCPIHSTVHSREHVIDAFLHKLVPAMDRFKPELVCISAGFDAHYLDPIGGFNLNEADFAYLTQIAIQIANKFSSGRIISVLEGGYHLRALASSVRSHCKELLL